MTKREHHRKPYLNPPGLSRRGSITKRGSYGRCTQYCGGYNDKTDKEGRDHRYHATKGWRTGCAVSGDNLTAQLMEQAYRMWAAESAARAAIRIEKA